MSISKLPLVLLPGMMCDARLFAPQVERFSAERTIVVPRIPDATGMHEIAETLLPQLPQEFALCGLSMGGIVAMEVLRQAPARVKKLALLDTNARAELPEVAAGRQAHIDLVRSGGLDDLMVGNFIPKYLTEPEKRPDIVQTCLEMARSIGPNSFESQSIALRDRPDQSETVKNCNVPMLILCGVDDQLCPVERHRHMHRLNPRSRLVILESAGHLPSLEKADEVNTKIGEWLNATQ